MKKHSFIFILSLLIATNMFASEGALVGEFSVSSSLKVHFSQGNLQYQASTNTFRFAAKQNAKASSTNNTSISSTYTGWIDLFAWGSSGYKIAPYINDNNEAKYYVDNVKDKDLAGTNYDWGKYNKISNGGNVTGRWRTLTSSEWNYLISSRSNAAKKRGLATITSVTGLVLLPDNWTLPSGCSFTPNASNYTTNTYTAETWAKMEKAGAVFLPLCGMRQPPVPADDKPTSMYGGSGLYWSSTACKQSTSNIYYYFAYFLYFASIQGGTGQSSSSIEVRVGTGAVSTGMPDVVRRYKGLSVRLVQNSSVYDANTYTITTSATNGVVTGGGKYDMNAQTILTATPNDCYAFTRWSDGNTDNPRTITVTGNATYTAEFTKINYTIKGQNTSTTGGSVEVVNP